MYKDILPPHFYVTEHSCIFFKLRRILFPNKIFCRIPSYFLYEEKFHSLFNNVLYNSHFSFYYSHFAFLSPLPSLLVLSFLLIFFYLFPFHPTYFHFFLPILYSHSHRLQIYFLLKLRSKERHVLFKFFNINQLQREEVHDYTNSRPGWISSLSPLFIGRVPMAASPWPRLSGRVPLVRPSGRVPLAASFWPRPPGRVPPVAPPRPRPPGRVPMATSV